MIGVQIAIWDVVRMSAAGRPTSRSSRRPWGCPVSVWRAACKRWERRQVADPIDAVATLAAESLRRPWPISIGTPRKEPRKVVVRGVSECSTGMRLLVQEGRMPGMTWEEGVGVVRWVR